MIDVFCRPLARFFFGKLVPRTAYPIVRGPLRGAKFILGTLAGEGGGAAIYFNLMEPEQNVAFANNIYKSDVVFDIGANVGYYSILASRLVGDQGLVVAIEPVIRNIFYLYNHTLLNNARNVLIVPAACCDVISVEEFAFGANYAIGSLTKMNKTGGTEKTASVNIVPTVTVDAISSKLNLLPSAIKIDVEGSELLVLQGAQQTLAKAKPKIFLSTHSQELRSACLEYLQGLGYTFEVLSRNRDNATEFLAKH